MQDFFPISFPTKAYLKPYIETLYGNPVYFNAKTTLGTILSTALSRPRRLHEKKEVISYRVFDRFDTQLKVYLPKWWLTKYEVGHTLEDEQIIAINKFFEEKFEESLVHFCSYAIIYQQEIKKALEDFCRRHHIEIEDHITYEALKRKEYRARKQYEKTFDITPAELSPVFLTTKTAKKNFEINTADLSLKKVASRSFIFS